MNPISILTAPAKWLWNKVTGRATVQATDESVGAGRDVSGQVAIGGTTSSDAGPAIGVARTVTINQLDPGAVAAIRVQLDELAETLSARGAAPAETEALVAAATAKSEKYLAEAIEFQKQQKEREAIDRLLTAYDMDLPPEAKAQLHVLVGHGFHRLGRWKEAEGQYLLSLNAAERAQSQPAIAYAVSGLGMIASDRGDPDTGEEYFKRALKIHEETGNRPGLAGVLGNLGILYQARGDRELAKERFAQSLALYEELTNLLGQANQEGNLGNVCLEEGQLNFAEDHHKRALDLDRRLGDERGESDDLGNLAIVHALQKNPDLAEREAGEALVIAAKIDHRLGQANALATLGSISLDRQQPDRAHGHFQSALTIMQEIGYALGEANLLGNLGLVARAKGDIGTARRLLSEARDKFAEINASGDAPHQVQQALDELDEEPLPKADPTG